MYRQLMTWIAALFVVFGLGPAHAGEGHAEHAGAAPAKKPQMHCPVRGGKIDKKVFVDYEGKRIYFCCPGCDKKFLADAKAMTEKMEAAGVQLETVAVQTVCPVSGDPIDQDVFVEYQGQKVYLCCGDCRGQFNADPENYMKKLAEQQAAAAKAKADAHGEADKGHEGHGGGHPKADAHQGHNH